MRKISDFFVAAVGLVLFLFWLVLPIHAQRANTFYVDQFPGSSVAQKTVKAQAACRADIPCVLIFDTSLANFPEGILPAQGANEAWFDYRRSGSFTVIPQAVKRLNGIRYADQFTDLAAATADIGTTAPGHVIIPASYTGTDCPALQSNIVYEDYRSGGRQGSVSPSTFICTNNIIQYNTITPGGTDALIRAEQSRSGVQVAGGANNGAYFLSHLYNGTVSSGGQVNGGAMEASVDGTFSGTLTNMTGAENAALLNGRGGTVTDAWGVQGYAYLVNGNTTAVTRAVGVMGVGCYDNGATVHPANCYGGFFSRQSWIPKDNPATDRRYAAGFEGLGMWQYDSSLGAGGFDCEDASHNVKTCFRIGSDNGVYWQAIDPTVGFVILSSTGASRYIFSDSLFKTNNPVQIGTNGTQVGTLQHKRVSGCATAATVGAVCTTTVTWANTFSDANYTAVCSGDLVTSGVPVGGGLSAKSATAATFRTVAMTAAAAQFTTIDCVAFHD